MLISGTATCNRCKQIVEWYYQVPNRWSDRQFDVDIVPKDKVGLRDKPYPLGGNRYTMTFWCPHCGYLSDFEYESDRALR